MADSFWTQARVAKLHDLWRSRRYSAADIGAMLGTTRNAVIGKVNGMPGGLRLKPASDAELITRMWLSGCLCSEIAKATGVKPSSVSNRVRQLGLPARKSGRACNWVDRAAFERARDAFFNGGISHETRTDDADRRRPDQPASRPSARGHHAR